jgi:hypothetical protein
MRIGLRDRPVALPERLAARLFTQRVNLPPVWERYYRGDVPTRTIPNERRHRLKLAV